MIIQNQNHIPDNNLLPNRFGVRQNTFKHKHHSCRIAGNYAWWLNNVYKQKNTPELQNDFEDKLVKLYGIPRWPISNEAWARKSAEVLWCRYELFDHFSVDFFNYLNAWYMITVPIHATQWFIDEWKAWKILTWWSGKVRGGHVFEMFKENGILYASNTQFDEENPVRKMEKLRLRKPFYLTKNEVSNNQCAILLPN